MKVRPMLGEYEFPGLEYVESLERRSLVEHAVPGLEGSYFQDLGSEPNTIIVTGSRSGDVQRDEFLEEVRRLFNAAEPTTFIGDIVTGTDLTQVVIEDLDVAEISGAATSFRYRVRLRKYTEPPEPAVPGLLDADILNDALALSDAFDLIDGLGSIPNLGDPTPPVREALGRVESATSGLDGILADLGSLFDPEAAAAAREARAAAEASGGTPPGSVGPAGTNGSSPTAARPDRGSPGGVSPGSAAQPGPGSPGRGGPGAGSAGRGGPEPSTIVLDPADPRVDAGTQPALQGVLNGSDQQAARSMASLLGDVAGGTLAGVHPDDSDAARALAAGYARDAADLIPSGESAALVLDPFEPLTVAPTVLLRRQTTQSSAALAAALQRLEPTVTQFKNGAVGPCASAASPVALPNLVPSTFCQIGGQPVVSTTPTVTYVRFERFGFDQSTIPPHHRAAITRVAHLVIDSQASEPIRTLTFVGHTDSTGDEDYNVALAERRANALRDALNTRLETLRAGASALVNIVVETRGEVDPVADNATPDGQARNRRVDLELAGTCLAYFSLVDLNYLPRDPVFGTPAHPALTTAQKNQHTADVEALLPVLETRSDTRACSANVGTVEGSQPAPPAPVLAAARRVSATLLALGREFFPDGSGGIDANRHLTCYQRFANGELRNPLPAQTEKTGLGEPDSAFFFYYSEFALICIENQIDAAAWNGVLRNLIGAQDLFVHTYRPPPAVAPPPVTTAPPVPIAATAPRARPLRAYRDQNFATVGQSNAARKQALRQKFATLGIDALRAEFAANLRRAQLMGPPDRSPRPDDGCSGSAPGPGGPVPTTGNPSFDIDPTDTRFDAAAKSSLRRLLADGDAGPRISAGRLIRGVKDGTIVGIFGDDGANAVALATAHGVTRLQLIRSGEDVSLVLDVTAPLTGPPTVIFRGGTPNIRTDQARMDDAMRNASATFEFLQSGLVIACAGNPRARELTTVFPTSFCWAPPGDQ